MADQEWWETDEENDEVATKRELWEPLSEALGGFDLDPAAGCEPTQIAHQRYTKADDGLVEPWFGTVWLNPPFSQRVHWYRRLVDHYERGAVDAAAAIAPTDFSADWFHDWFARADAIGLLDGRDWYIGHGSSPSFATAVGLWSPTDDALAVLASKGTVVHPQQPDQASLQDFGGESR
jgi:hypothetical protein